MDSESDVWVESPFTAQKTPRPNTIHNVPPKSAAATPGSVRFWPRTWIASCTRASFSQTDSGASGARRAS